MSELNFQDYRLSDVILKALNLLGYKEPTRVQGEVIPYGLKKQDLIVKSQTGSGKTAAFGIPICENAIIEERNPQALVLTPTRELCVQVKEDITNIGRFKRVRAAAIFGKQPVEMQVRELKQRVHVVVGTPGRTLDLMKRGNLVLDDIRYLIVDEADKMLNMGFIDEVEDIIKRLPKNRVTMLFSATIPEEIEALCRKYINDAAVIEISPENIASKSVEQNLYEASPRNKVELLRDLLYVENPDSAIIFCATKDNVDTLVKQLKKDGFLCEAIHGGLLQAERLDVMKKFKSGEFRFLIATDVAARGIDIESLSLIVNFDVPVEKESYVHRIGRTGRAGKTGKAITLVTAYEERMVAEIEEYIGFKVPRKVAPSSEEIEKGKKAFKTKSAARVTIKPDKGEQINKQITKLYIGAGKKKKFRAGDIVGAISSIEGVSGEDVGIIDIQDNFTYVDILNGKGDKVMESLNNMTVKGKTLRVEKAVK